MLAGTTLRLARSHTVPRTTTASLSWSRRHLHGTSPLLRSPYYRPRRDKGVNEEDEVVRPPTRLEIFELTKNFRQRSQSQDVSVEEATECLSKARKHCEIYFQNQRDDACRELNLGVTTLNWYQGKYPDHTRGKEESVDFMKHLCWHLVVQGREDLIWGWIGQIGDEVTRTMPTKEATVSPVAYAWTGRLLGGFVDAQIASAPQRSPSAAMQTFRRLMKLTCKGGEYEKYFVPLDAGMAINRRLVERDCPPVDAKLLERFCKASVVFSARNKLENEARLRLYHPQRADATRFYRLVEAGDRYLSERLFDFVRDQARFKLVVDFFRAAYMLRLRGCEREASHLEDIVQRKTPAMYGSRAHLRRESERDSRLDHVRSEATMKKGTARDGNS